MSANNPQKGYGRYAHLSAPSEEWAAVSESQKLVDKKADELYSLPIHEIRQMPYRPAPLPANAPAVGRDLSIRQSSVAVRDGAMIMIRIYQPVQITRGHPLYFNIHGGGWTVGSPETEEGQNRLVCVRNNAVVVSVDYRRAPEFPFPYAIDDSLDVLKWSLGADPSKTIIGGGSAGANVATVISHMLRDEGLDNIKGQLLNIPVTCHPDHRPKELEYSSFEQNADAPIVSAERMRWFWANYLPSGGGEDPRASPLLARNLRELPSALIQVAGIDPLRDEGIAYAEALEANDIDVTLNLYPGMPHAFYTHPEMRSTIQYQEAMVDWFDMILSREK